MQYYNSNQIKLIYKGYKVCKEMKHLIPRKIYEIPYISYGYWNPKPLDTEDVIIPIYITDFYQCEYIYNDTSLRFKLRIEVDGIVTWKENLQAGDYDLNLGKFKAGMHWFTLQVVDQYGEESGRIANDLWVINEEEYRIKDEEIYTITSDDLLANNITINLDNTATVEQMQNNRVGLSQLFLNIRSRGYRKIILPQGIYRVNRTIRQGTIENKTICIDIPSGLTVDMNGSTFKLHPYDDREYGDVAKVENLIVRMKSCTDSHLINGTIEGDFNERKTMTWTDDTNALDNGNGEHCNAIYIYGGKYNSIENITITQVSGYNVGVGQNPNTGTFGWTASVVGNAVDNIRLVNGVEIQQEGYCTSPFTDITENLDGGYIVVGVYLMFGGVRGDHWDVDFNFYNENKEFIEKIRCYQYRRCKIPYGTKYVRTTFKTSPSNIEGVSYHYMESARYCEIKNCDFIDNRTCLAICQHQHLLIDNCNFTRSGQSITPCEIDLEDGWEQSQDFFLRNCERIEYIGTGGIIDNAGINHVFENNINWNYTIRDRVNGVTIKNNTECDTIFVLGAKTKNTIRIIDNNFVQLLLSFKEFPFYLYEYAKYKSIGGSIIADYFVGQEGNKLVVQDCNLTLGRHGLYTFINCNIKLKGEECYILQDVICKNCTFETYPGQLYSKFSFNAVDAYRLYEKCIFNTPCQFFNHNLFNSGIFTECVFNDTLCINTNKANKLGQIQFNNCTFNKELTINLGDNTYIQFNNCTFASTPIFNGTSQDRCEFNN